jgi:lipopolysaccharide transport system ATP-binding protein
MIPTVFYITHPKAGSQWLKRILHDMAPRRIRMDADVYLTCFFHQPLYPGAVYPTIYTSKPTFDFVTACDRQAVNAKDFLKEQVRATSERWYRWNRFLFQTLRWPTRRFFVMRDLRDTLVSFYFSMARTHKIMREEHQQLRNLLKDLDVADGLLALLSKPDIVHYAMIQVS